MSTNLKVIAQQGSRFLVNQGDEMAKVVDLRGEVVYPSFNKQSILARGYWESVKDSEKAKDALKLANRQG